MSEKKNFWIKIQNDWISNRDSPQFVNIPLINYVNNLLDDTKIILDVGTGTGRYLNLFTKCKKIYGIDFISKFIESANIIKPVNCELFVDDIVNLKFDKKVDIIFTMTVIQHITPEQVESAIQNLTKLQAKDIILWECTNLTYYNNGFPNDGDNYMFGHDYIKYFNMFNYELVYSQLWSNNITYLLHFKLKN